MSNSPSPLTTMVSFRVTLPIKRAMENAARSLDTSTTGVLMRCLEGTFNIKKYLKSLSDKDYKDLAAIVQKNLAKKSKRV